MRKTIRGPVCFEKPNIRFPPRAVALRSSSLLMVLLTFSRLDETIEHRMFRVAGFSQALRRRI